MLTGFGGNQAPLGVNYSQRNQEEDIGEFIYTAAPRCSSHGARRVTTHGLDNSLWKYGKPPSVRSAKSDGKALSSVALTVPQMSAALGLPVFSIIK